MMINMLTYSGISIFYIALQDIGDPIPVRKRESKLMSLTDDTRRDATAVELCESTDDSEFSAGTPYCISWERGMFDAPRHTQRKRRTRVRARVSVTVSADGVSDGSADTAQPCTYTVMELVCARADIPCGMVRGRKIRAAPRRRAG